MASAHEPVVLQRQDLHDLVWAEPVSKVAARYGISDVALAKACRRLGVPLPQRGYWSKIAAGHPPNKPRLPPIEPGVSKEYRLEPALHRPRPSDAPAAVNSKWKQAEVPDVAVVVASVLTNPHPLVRAALKEFKSREVYSYNGLRRIGTPFDVEVSPAASDRAFRIFDSLFKALEQAGCKVRPSQNYNERGSVLVDGERIMFRMKERLRRTDHVPGKGRIFEPKYDFLPAGELRLKLWWSEPYTSEREFKDSPKQPLEMLAGHVFSAFFQAAADRKSARARYEEAARERANEERRAYERKEAQQREHERVQILRKAARDWEEAKLLRAYVAEVEARAHAVGVTQVYGQPLQSWTEWARQVAEETDPLRRLYELAEQAKPNGPTTST